MKFAEAGKQVANLVAGAEPVKMDGKGCFRVPDDILLIES